MHTKLTSLLPGNKITNLLRETDDNQSVKYNSIILITINRTLLFHDYSIYDIINYEYFAIIHSDKSCVLFYFSTLSTTFVYHTQVWHETQIFISLKPCNGLHIQII